MSINFNIKFIPFFSNKKIVGQKILSRSFGMICEKIDTENNYSFVLKRRLKKNYNYNALTYEGKSLVYMNELFPDLFPNIYYQNDEFLIMDYIKHDQNKGDNYEKQLAEKISSIHKIKNRKFGFKFHKQLPRRIRKQYLDIIYIFF